VWLPGILVAGASAELRLSLFVPMSVTEFSVDFNGAAKSQSGYPVPIRRVRCLVYRRVKGTRSDKTLATPVAPVLPERELGEGVAPRHGFEPGFTLRGFRRRAMNRLESHPGPQN
jgi:hypothetical protein